MILHINNGICLIDDIDMWACFHSWSIDIGGYAYATIGGKTKKLHLMIARSMNLDGQIDHADRNKLNNQRTNLRLATGSQNSANKDIQINNTSGFKGVHWHNATGKWRAMISIKSKSKCLGLYENIVDAAKAYDIAALQQYGDFAVINFPFVKES